MSGEYEALLRDAFSGLGSYAALANGFRLQAPSGQTCAVYFSGNAPGNAIEIGLSPNALAPILGRAEGEIRDWVAAQAAVTGRERIVSGARGSFPGLALGSQRELEAFLDAWQEFAHPALPISGLEAARLDKAAEDAGFDLTPLMEGGWRVFRSTAFPYVMGVRVIGDEQYAAGFTVAIWGHKVAHDNAMDSRPSTGPWEAVIDDVQGYERFYWMVIKAGGLARLIAKIEAEEPPMATETERMAIERIGQEAFRQSLIEYWRGRCAVTGLDVVPLLRASHIKPWADCASDAERLDVFNGFLLAPHVDALFDGGWISFGDDGVVMVSAKLSPEQQALIGLRADWRIQGLLDAHRAYLSYHRLVVFQG